MQQYFNRKHRVKDTAIRVGDWVRAHRPLRCNKMASYWTQPPHWLAAMTFMLSDRYSWHAKRQNPVQNPYEKAAAPPPPASPLWVPACREPQGAPHTHTHFSNHNQRPQPATTTSDHNQHLTCSLLNLPLASSQTQRGACAETTARS